MQRDGTRFDWGLEPVVLNANQQPSVGNLNSLTQWADRALGISGIHLNVQVRGKQLHIWCEGRDCPDATVVMARFSQAIHQDLPLPEELEIEQVFLYGRHRDPAQPMEAESDPHNLDWTVRFEVNPLEALRKEPLQEDSISRHSAKRSSEVRSAREPNAIARQLNQSFAHLGVRVKVSVKHLEDSQSLNQLYRRLWVLCESTYTPNSTLLGEPIAQQLRDLRLRGFRDAVILGQVSGETKPEWMLRVDLTPPEQILNTWAHWGDVAAIAERLNRSLTPEQLQVSAVLKESTLHVFCCPHVSWTSRDSGESDTPTAVSSPLPHRSAVMETISPILEKLAPRGIQAATIYGLDQPYEASFPEPTAPLWVAWLDLPASRHSNLATPALSLSRQGELRAITFMLERLLNPDLNQKLLTGGTRIKTRRKADLLHVMSEALVCPQQTQVIEPIVKFLRQLQLKGIAGVRIYGRRSGQKQPRWSYGVDFQPRTVQSPEKMPEFAASEADVGDLLPHSELSVTNWERERPSSDFRARGLVSSLQTWLCGTQLFTRQSTHSEADFVPARWMDRKLTIALVWGTLGLLFTFSSDLWLAQMLQDREMAKAAAQQETQMLESHDGGERSLSQEEAPDSRKPNLEETEGVFNSSGFTAVSPAEDKAQRDRSSPRIQLAEGTAVSELSYPTFNSQQLDGQLALYQKYINEFGVPDVLIVGSSRALRGIDPAIVEQTLVEQGYPDIRVFNFGINGATAQVVNLLVGQILLPGQLPNLIVWADGARAFNSGRDDRTYEAIALSAGYKQLMDGRSPIQQPEDHSPPPSPPPSFFKGLASRYQSLDENLNQILAKYSALYERRETLAKELLEAIDSEGVAPPSETIVTEVSPSGDDGEILYDNGFFALSVRFDPATYYQNHPEVPGDYDSDYNAFQLRGKQAAAFYSLLESTQTQGIELVFVNLPLTQNYLDPIRMKYERDFQQYMMLSAKEQGFIFRNLFDLLLDKPQYFSDPSHLNRDGARSVSDRLAQDPMIPWLVGSEQ